MEDGRKRPAARASREVSAVVAAAHGGWACPFENPALVDVEVCSVTACSLNPPHDYFLLYKPDA